MSIATPSGWADGNPVLQRILASACRRTMRPWAQLVRDIRRRRRQHRELPADRDLEPMAIELAIRWRERAAGKVAL